MKKSNSQTDPEYPPSQKETKEVIILGKDSRESPGATLIPTFLQSLNQFIAYTEELLIKMDLKGNYYQLLGVSRSSLDRDGEIRPKQELSLSDKKIKNAWHQASKRVNPDRHRGRNFEIQNQKQQQVNEAQVRFFFESFKFFCH